LRGREEGKDVALAGKPLKDVPNNFNWFGKGKGGGGGKFIFIKEGKKGVGEEYPPLTLEA